MIPKENSSGLKLLVTIFVVFLAARPEEAAASVKKERGAAELLYRERTFIGGFPTSQMRVTRFELVIRLIPVIQTR